MGQEEGRETGRSGEPGLFPVLGRKVGLAAFCSGHRRNSLSHGRARRWPENWHMGTGGWDRQEVSAFHRLEQGQGG